MPILRTWRVFAINNYIKEQKNLNLILTPQQYSTKRHYICNTFVETKHLNL